MTFAGWVAFAAAAPAAVGALELMRMNDAHILGHRHGLDCHDVEGHELSVDGQHDRLVLVVDCDHRFAAARRWAPASRPRTPRNQPWRRASCRQLGVRPDEACVRLDSSCLPASPACDGVLVGGPALLVASWRRHHAATTVAAFAFFSSFAATSSSSSSLI